MKVYSFTFPELYIDFGQ